MIQKRGKWHCFSCESVSEDAHLNAFDDYRLLIESTIKNRDARRFLKVDSVHVMKRIMMNSGFKFTGNTSARRYVLTDKV